MKTYTNQTPTGRLKSFLGLDNNTEPLKTIHGKTADVIVDEQEVSIETICTDALLSYFKLRLVSNPDFQKGHSIKPLICEPLPGWR